MNYKKIIKVIKESNSIEQAANTIVARTQAPASREVERLTRYDMGTRERAFYEESWSEPAIVERHDGDYVLFDDVKALFAKPESRVPEKLLNRIKSLLINVGHHGIPITEEGQCYEIGATEVAEAQELVGMLTTTTEPATGWIMCSERLPKVGQKVRLKRNGEELPYMPSFQFNTGKVFWDFDDYDADPNILPTDKWMPRNNPPQTPAGGSEDE